MFATTFSALLHLQIFALAKVFTTLTLELGVFLIQMNRQPIDLYNVLKEAGYIKGDSNETTLEDGTVLPATKRVKYKGPDLEDDILGKLDSILSTKGYERIKQKTKDYGEKYVWLQK